MRASAVPLAEQSVPIVVAEEVMRGQLSTIRRAQTGVGRISLEQAYDYFQEALSVLRNLQFLPYTTVAAAISSLASGEDSGGNSRSTDRGHLRRTRRDARNPQRPRLQPDSRFDTRRVELESPTRAFEMHDTANQFCGRTRREFLWETGAGFAGLGLTGTARATASSLAQPADAAQAASRSSSTRWPRRSR